MAQPDLLTDPTASTPFGSVLVPQMATAQWDGRTWASPRLEPLRPLELHPAAHVLHYASACFEGLKAHRGHDGVVRVFRMDRHVERLRRSAEGVVLPVPSADLVASMIVDVVRAALHEVPDPPGSLYLRPTLIGTDPAIGAAGHPSRTALLFVLASPVGDYFPGGIRPLTLALETRQPRTTPQFGAVKAGANYVMALGTTLQAERQGADQVLFAPGGVVQETGASNVLLLDGERVVTPALDAGFLDGVTRDSLLRLARDLGLQIDERPLTVEELLAWADRADAEAAVCGTGAGLVPVGALLVDGERVDVGTGEVGPTTRRLRDALSAVQRGERPDPDAWLTPVAPET